jgi:dTMP kinase
MSLVVIEGIDGTGKSTQAQFLEDRLKEKKRGLAKNGVVRIAEPTKSSYGIKIREAMMRATDRLSFEEELDLFVQDRKLNVEQNIRPALAQGKVVILDRYYFSTAAYQGTRGKMSWQEILAINEQFAPKPDILLVFFLPVDKALERIDKDAKSAKRESRSYMERKDTLEKVQAAFQQIHDSKAYNSFAIDASRQPEALREEIWKIYEKQVKKQQK